MRKVAAIHDLSCYGRCSLAVILPVLSVMGMQCCPLPGTVLSTHTGGFGPVQRTDLTGQVDGTLRHWEELGLRFDGIYTGYMASAAQIHQAMEAVERLSGENTQVVVDPVLGDHGKLYTSITPEMAQAMGTCARRPRSSPPTSPRRPFSWVWTRSPCWSSGERTWPWSCPARDSGRWWSLA